MSSLPGCHDVVFRGIIAHSLLYVAVATDEYGNMFSLPLPSLTSNPYINILM